MERKVISILVENHPGVLSRISGLFSRRGFNIDSLAVGTTEQPGRSRMTIGFYGDAYLVEQITKQLYKQIPVLKVIELSSDPSILRELLLVKMRVKPGKRRDIMELAEIFRANIIDVSADTITLEATGDRVKIDALVRQLEPFGIYESVRTGCTGLLRG